MNYTTSYYNIEFIFLPVKKPVYQLVGNGWCRNGNNQRIRALNTRKIEVSWSGYRQYPWRIVKVNADGSAAYCESNCSLDPTCIGYMTEDGTKCDVLLTTDDNAEGGITHVDRETRNYCWKKSSGKLLL